MFNWEEREKIWSYVVKLAKLNYYNNDFKKKIVLIWTVYLYKTEFNFICKKEKFLLDFCASFNNELEKFL